MDLAAGVGLRCSPASPLFIPTTATKSLTYTSRPLPHTRAPMLHQRRLSAVLTAGQGHLALGMSGPVPHGLGEQAQDGVHPAPLRAGLVVLPVHVSLAQV